jgi:hypothetical protein
MEDAMRDRDVEVLDAFGKALIRQVRDGTLAEMDDILLGRGLPEWTRELHGSLERSMDAEQRALLRHTVAIAVDTALHNVLWMLEKTPKLRLEVELPDGDRVDIVAVSDGLAAEPASPDGWIARFSQDEDPGRSVSD